MKDVEFVITPEGPLSHDGTGKTCGNCRHLDPRPIDNLTRRPTHYCNKRCTWEDPRTLRGEPVVSYGDDMFCTAYHCRAWAAA